MGNGVSVQTKKKQAIMSKRIDKLIASDKERDLKLVKLLLLGGSECGKSTLAKQIKILHCNGFSDAESEYFCLLSRQNIIESIALCIDRLDLMKLDYTGDSSFADHVALIRKLCSEREWTSIEPQVVGPILEDMWAHRFVRQSFNNVNNNCDYTTVPDNLFYFMGNIKRIFSTDFKVNHDDILHARTMTTGIVELDFSYRNLMFKLVDVGGQRSQRKKWIHCFDNVMAILFLVAMSEYDQFLAENTDVNRMKDSLQLFHSISNAFCFEKIPVVLFFNKKDIFENKISKSPLSICFKDYAGENTFAMASEYMKQEFLKRKPEAKSIYSHFTNATDTENINLVFGATVDIIMANSMANSGLN